MADVTLTDVLRLIGRNQIVTAPNALSSIWRLVVGRDDDHVTSLFSFFILLGKYKSIMTVVRQIVLN
jgi:hypothetical protein